MPTLPEVAAAAMAFGDASFDPARGLLWNPPGSFDDLGLPPRTVHLVPQSAWYAVGLLGRGDTAQAERVLEELCALQYRMPGVTWHGTFARFAEWPQPPELGAIEWADYDPNWRQFVGTCFALILQHFDVSRPTRRRLRHAVASAIAGEPPDRITPGYSNIALMHAWLTADEDLARAVRRAFEEHGAFEEYNSPTYYGIDLYALALWRRFPPTPKFAKWGKRMWRALWTDIARWWHPGLRNLCGPYSRAYGMDMARYAALLELWMPDPRLPDLSGPLEHSHDLLMAPLVALVGGRPKNLELTDVERVVEQSLPGDRVATGWLAPGVMAGGARGARFRAEGQFHPATAHWALLDGGVGWLRLRHRGPLSVTVGEAELAVVVHDHKRLGRQPVVVETSHPGRFESDAWHFEGRAIAYEGGPPASATGVIDAGGEEVLRLRLA